MGDWATKIIETVDTKLKGTKDKDLRFYRIDEFKRNIERIDSFSQNCPYCLKQKTGIAEVVEKIDHAVHTPGKDRREYDRLISKLSGHMQKEHGFHTPFYFVYLYSFFGMVAGMLAGYLLLKIFPAYNWVMLSIGFSAGLLTGYFIGSSKDNKIRVNKKLM